MTEVAAKDKGQPAAPAPPAARDALPLVGAVIGGAAWVGVVGGVVLAVRFADIGVPPGPTVALLPTTVQAVVGLRFLAIPLLAALAAYLYLLYRRPRDGDSPESDNAPGALPVGWIQILLVGVGSGLGVAVFSSTAPLARLGIVVLVIAGAVILALSLKKAHGFAIAGYILFLVVAVTAGLIAITFEWGHDTRLDIAAAVRKDGRTLAGYYVAKTDSTVYLVTPVSETQTSSPVDDQAASLPATAERCESSDAAGILRGASEPCYYNELLALPAVEVQRLVIGPRGVAVDAAGYQAASRLAKLVRQTGDEPPAVP